MRLTQTGFWKRFIICLLILVGANRGFAQIPEWIRSMGGSDNEDGVAVAVDEDGNVYQFSTLRSSFVLLGITIPISSSEISIVKYSPKGEVIWYRTAGGLGTQWARDITVYQDEVYITGGFKDFMSFNYINYINGSNGEVFVAKYDTAGNYIWGRRAGGGGSPPYSQSYTIQANQDGVYVGGMFTGLMDFNPSRDVTQNTISTGNNDPNYFLAKYSPDGNYLWGRSGGSASAGRPYPESILDIALDDNYVYFTGGVYPGSIFTTPPPASNVSFFPDAAGDSLEIILGCYGQDGSLQWFRRAGGGQEDMGRGIEVTSNAIYLTGEFQKDARFYKQNGDSIILNNAGPSATSSDIFVAQFDLQGYCKWAKRAGGSQDDRGEELVFTQDKLYVTGSFRGTSNFNTPPDASSNTLTAVGQDDIFMAKYDTLGNIFSYQGFGDTQSDRGVDLIALDSSIYLIGDYQQGLSIPNLMENITSEGSEDIIVFKFKDTSLVSSPPNIQILGSDSLCVGELRTYTAQPDTSSLRWRRASQPGVNPGSSYDFSATVAGKDTLFLLFQSFTVDTLLITVVDPPQPTILGDPLPCIGKLSNYSVDSPNPGSLYTWSMEGGSLISVPGSPNAQVQWDTASVTRLIVQETTPLGCMGADTLEVTVRYVPFGSSLLCPDDPLPSIQIQGANPTCLDEVLSLSAQPDTVDLQWQWSARDSTRAGRRADLSWAQTGTDSVFLYFQGTLVDTALITVHPLPIPEIQGDASPCVGKETTYTLSTLAPGNNYFWDIQGGTILSSQVGTSLTVRWEAEQNTRLILRETNAAGCQNVDTLDLSVRYVPFGSSFLCPDDPLPSIQIQGPTSVCLDGELALIAQPDTVDLQWEWSLRDSTSLGSTASLSWSQAGTDTVFLSFQGMVVDTALVTINPPPNPVIQGDTRPCVGIEANYTLNDLVPGSHYFWEVEGGSILSGQTSSQVRVRWDSVQANRLIVRETDAEGCENSGLLDIQVRYLRFGNTLLCPDNTLPNYQIQGPETVCQGQNVRYKVNPDTNAVIWKTTSGLLLGNGATLDWAWAHVGTDNLLLELGGLVLDSLPIQIIEELRPQIQGPELLCQDSMSIYTIISNDPSAPLHWFVDGGQLMNDPRSSIVQVRWQGGGPARLWVEQGVDCLGTDTLYVQVKANPSPQIVGDTLVCNGEESTYTLAEAGDSILWEIEGGTILNGQNTKRITVRWQIEQEGALRVAQTTSNTFCRAQGDLSVRPSTNFINSLQVSSSAEGPEACLKSPVRLFAEAKGPVERYDWYRLDNDELIGSGASVNIQRAGRYQVIALGACNQLSSDTLLVQSPGILVPNLFTPNQDRQDDRFLLHTYDLSSIEKIELRVFDRRGNLVYTTEQISEAFEKGWDGGNLSNGSYLWTLKVQDKNCGAYQQKGVINLLR